MKPSSTSNSDLELPHTLQSDKKKLSEVKVPIVTSSASFRSDILKDSGERARVADHDIVFSRGHFSMSTALTQTAREEKLSSWLIDPTNYVSKRDWQKLKFVVRVGQAVARFPLLKRIKDRLDSLTRDQLPITKAITKPLLYATSETTRPIISVHYETGNILARQGKRVVQVVTDPHVRPQYLEECERENIIFAVFNKKTKQEFLKLAKADGKKIKEEKIVVTGPPVDPRIVRARNKKHPTDFKKRPLRLVITTGGLGQNKDEIEKITTSIAPKIKEGTLQVILYASTLPNFREMYEEIAAKFYIPLGSNVSDEDAPLRIIYSSSIVDANRSLLEYGFSWADGFITKPSGDMAYDAAGAGCFILSLTPWGDWEKNVETIFEKLGILKKADPENFASQLGELTTTGWISSAIKNALEIKKIFTTGAQNIIKLQQSTQ